jgi:hypothetical protein
MANHNVLDTAAITAALDRKVVEVRRMRLHERVAMLEDACRAAAALEEYREKMGLPPSKPAPWPESTRRFLQAAANRLRSQIDP